MMFLFPFCGFWRHWVGETTPGSPTTNSKIYLLIAQCLSFPNCKCRRNSTDIIKFKGLNGAWKVLNTVTVTLKWSISHSVMFDSLWPMNYSPPGSSVHGIFQVIILEWVAIPFSRGSSWPREQIQVSCTAGRFFTIWATREVLTQNLTLCLSSCMLYSIVYWLCCW